MEIIKTDLNYAILTLGLRKGYTNEVITVDAVYNTLSELQEQLINKDKIYLSANCYESMIVLSGQVEPHINLKFINYPRFLIEEVKFRSSVIELSKKMADIYQQNRVVIEFKDGFVMLQNNAEIDPSIVIGE